MKTFNKDEFLRWKNDNALKTRTVAVMLGVNVSTITRWETGELVPSISAMLAIKGVIDETEYNVF